MTFIMFLRRHLLLVGRQCRRNLFLNFLYDPISENNYLHKHSECIDMQLLKYNANDTRLCVQKTIEDIACKMRYMHSSTFYFL